MVERVWQWKSKYIVSGTIVTTFLFNFQRCPMSILSLFVLWFFFSSRVSSYWIYMRHQLSFQLHTWFPYQLTACTHLGACIWNFCIESSGVALSCSYIRGKGILKCSSSNQYRDMESTMNFFMLLCFNCSVMKYNCALQE